MMQSVHTILLAMRPYTHGATYVLIAAVFAVSALLPNASEASAQLIDENTFIEAETAHSFPVSGDREASREMKLVVTAYSSEPWQTDSTPFNTADGTYVRDGLIAANFLPLGTRVKFPELYGDKEFIVKDRMNARYWYRADIWMAETPMARQFGAQYTTMEIY
jgi:3D (Asp-Asp-Asp) domain-containing protein